MNFLKKGNQLAVRVDSVGTAELVELLVWSSEMGMGMGKGSGLSSAG